jgi:tryptophan-rich sensory protein
MNKTLHLPQKLRWYHGVLFFIIVNLIGGYGITLFVNIREVYSSLNLPWFAPPVWLFGLAWTTNNILTIYGNIITYNSPKSILRTIILRLQAWSWLVFVTFQYLSFGTGIPTMYFAPTFLMLVLNVLTLYFAFRFDSQKKPFWSTVKSGKSVTFSLLSLVSWLCIATILGFYIMILN